MERFTGILGILAILLVCVLFSNHKRAIRPSLIFWGVGSAARVRFCGAANAGRARV